MLPYALARLGRLELEAGRWASAEATLTDAVDLARDMGQDADAGIALGALAWLDAARGREETARARAAEALARANELGAGSGLDYAGAAIGLLELGLGHAEIAASRLETSIDRGAREGWSDAAAPPHRVPDLVEALVRAGLVDRAVAVLEPFRSDAERSRRPSAVAAALRCAGLVAADDAIDEPFAAATAIAGVAPFELARTRLCYGERLRRLCRRVEGREQVRAALETFELLGAAPWAERAGDELRASGEVVRRRDPSAVDRLTPSEHRISMLVARGATNKEVAAQLFVTPKTVEFHLGRVFRKLGLRTRAELAYVVRETP